MTAWLTQSLVACTGMMLVVLALRLPVARYFGPRAAYSLWILPGLRMVLPPLPGLPSLFDRVATIVVPFTRTDAPGSQMVAGSGTRLLFLIWCLGSIGSFTFHAIGYVRFRRAATFNAVRLDDMSGPAVVLSAAVNSPVAAGVLDPIILVPADFGIRYSTGERRLALLHERLHHERRDPLANWGAMLLLAVHWWNPIAYLAHRLFHVDQELACDADTVGALPSTERFDYGAALLKSAGHIGPTIVRQPSYREELRRRLLLLRAPGVPDKHATLAAVIALAVIPLGVAVTASGEAGKGEATHQEIAPARPVRASDTLLFASTIISISKQDQRLTRHV